jgi:PAS domain S-box-containing protein
MARDRSGATTRGDLHEPEAPWLGYQQFVEFAADAYLGTDSHGVIVAANQAAANVLQCPKEFLIGKPLGLLVEARNRRRFYECLGRLNDTATSDEFEARAGRGRQLRDLFFRVVALAVDQRREGELALRWLVRDMTERRQAEAAREELLGKLVSAQEDERRRVARELHDSLGQLMAAILLQIQSVRDAGPLPQAATVRLDELQRLAHGLSRAAHELAVRLRPPALDDVGLRGALKQYLADWAARTGVAAQFQSVEPEAARFPPEIETALYRVVQEALTNVARHAHARRVSLVIQEQDGCAIAALDDDGLGFDTEATAVSGRLGLIGMRERMTLVGGTLEVESSAGAGTTVIARVRLHR